MHAQTINRRAPWLSAGGNESVPRAARAQQRSGSPRQQQSFAPSPPTVTLPEPSEIAVVPLTREGTRSTTQAQGPSYAAALSRPTRQSEKDCFGKPKKETKQLGEVSKEQVNTVLPPEAPSNATRSSSSTTSTPTSPFFPSTPILQSEPSITCEMCRRQHNVDEWEGCFTRVHQRLFGQEVSDATHFRLKVSNDLKYYPDCNHLGCPVSSCPGYAGQRSWNHTCNFVPVMKPMIRYAAGGFGYPSAPSMAQAPLAIIQPQITSSEYYRRRKPMPSDGEFNNTIRVISGKVLGKKAGKTFPCAFRYEQLRQQAQPDVLNKMLQLEHAKLPSSLKGRVLVLLGSLDEKTRRWIRGSRLSPTLIPSVTVLLLLTTLTGKDYLICLYDGAKSNMYETASFNKYTQEMIRASSALDNTLDQHFRQAAKHVRKTGELDDLLGKPLLTENIFFSLPSTFLYELTTKVNHREIVQEAEFRARFDAVRAKTEDTAGNRLRAIQYKPHQLPQMSGYDFFFSEEQMSRLQETVGKHKENTLFITTRKIQELSEAVRLQGDRDKTAQLLHQQDKHALYERVDVTDVVLCVQGHLQKYAASKVKNKLVYHLDIEHIIKDFCEIRTYSPTMNSWKVPKDDHPPIYNASQHQYCLNRPKGSQDSRTIFHSAASDRSSLGEFIITVDRLPHAVQQPIYFLADSNFLDEIERSLESDEKSRSQVCQLLAHERNSVRKSDSLRFHRSSDRDSHLTVTYILIYALTWDGMFMVSGERPHQVKGGRAVPRASHSQLAGGLPVFAAGELVFEERRGEGKELVEITNGSGHYKPSTNTLNKALRAFSDIYANTFDRSDGSRVRQENAVARGTPILSQLH